MMVVMILLALSLILNAYLAIKLILAQRAIDSAIQLTKELIKAWDVASQVIGEIKERSDEC